MSPGPSRRHLRRTWPQRLLIVFNVCCIVAALAGAGSLAYAKKTVSQIKRTELGSSLESPDSLADGEPQNFLIVGVDSDDGLDDDDPARAGRDSGADAVVGLRSDTIMVVRIDPGNDEVRVLSFPRDLWVDIPGRSSNKINAALTYGDGSPDLLIDTIKQNFQISINHYVQVNFAGFNEIVKIIDGVPIWFDTPVRDTNSGLNVQQAGCTVLDGETGALSYVRSRHFQYQNDRGRWVSDPYADLGRVSRQQDFIKRVIRRAISKGARNPRTLARMLDAGTKNLVLDEVTKPQDLIDLGKAFRSFDPETLKTYSLPVTDSVRGGAAVLDLVEGEAQQYLDLFRGTGDQAGSADVPPGDIPIRVSNGTGTPNQATDTTNAFAAAGFDVRSPLPDGERVLRTEIRFRPGQDVQAMTVARYLDADPMLVPDADVEEVTVVTGPDLVEVLRTPQVVTVSTTTSTSTTSTTTTPPVTEEPVVATTTTAPVDEVASSEAKGYVPGEPPEGVACG